VPDMQEEYKGREASLYRIKNYNDIVPKKRIMGLKLIHICVTEPLGIISVKL
jgi:hypothetical protein